MATRFRPSPAAISPFESTGTRAKQKKERGFVKRLLGFISGLVWLVLATSLFFGVLAVASYYVLGHFIRGEEIDAPDLTARPVIEALEIAKEHDLSVEFNGEEPSEMLAEGEILSQNPKPGTKIKSRTPIRVVVSSGARQTVLPEQVVGQTRLQAGITLRELGLDTGEIAYLPVTGQNPDVVLATDPPPGTGVPPGSKVNLLVAAETGARTYLMPDLYGLTPEQANVELARYGLKVNQIEEEFASGAVPGGVIKQNPTAGSPIGEGTSVTITTEPAN
jgi:beta-lactam-binding protein with PASTA domain